MFYISLLFVQNIVPSEMQHQPCPISLNTQHILYLLTKEIPIRFLTNIVKLLSSISRFFFVFTWFTAFLLTNIPVDGATQNDLMPEYYLYWRINRNAVKQGCQEITVVTRDLVGGAYFFQTRCRFFHSGEKINISVWMSGADQWQTEWISSEAQVSFTLSSQASNPGPQSRCAWKAGLEGAD